MKAKVDFSRREVFRINYHLARDEGKLPLQAFLLALYAARPVRLELEKRRQREVHVPIHAGFGRRGWK